MPLPLGRDHCGFVQTHQSKNKHIPAGRNGGSHPYLHTCKYHTQFLLDPSAAFSRFLMAMAIQHLHLFLTLEFGSFLPGCRYSRRPLLHLRSGRSSALQNSAPRADRALHGPSSESSQSIVRCGKGWSPVIPPSRDDPNHHLLI